MFYDSGELTQRVVLKNKTSTRDAMGGETITYTTLVEVSAKAEQVRGREYVALAQTQSEMDVTFSIYYREDIDADSRVEWRGKDYDLIGPPIDVKSRKEQLELMCKTAQT